MYVREQTFNFKLAYLIAASRQERVPNSFFRIWYSLLIRIDTANGSNQKRVLTKDVSITLRTRNRLFRLNSTSEIDFD